MLFGALRSYRFDSRSAWPVPLHTSFSTDGAVISIFLSLGANSNMDSNAEKQCSKAASKSGALKARAVAAMNEINYKCLPCSTVEGQPVVVSPKVSFQNVHAYTHNGLEVYNVNMRLELSWIDNRFINWPRRAPVPPVSIAPPTSLMRSYARTHMHACIPRLSTTFTYIA